METLAAGRVCQVVQGEQGPHELKRSPTSNKGPAIFTSHVHVEHHVKSLGLKPLPQRVEQGEQSSDSDTLLQTRNIFDAPDPVMLHSA